MREKAYSKSSATVLLCLFLFLTISVSAYAEEGLFDKTDWINKTIEGFSFSFPDDWEYSYIGEENMGAIPAIMLELKYVDELRCIIRILLIPEMPAELIPGELKFKDFLLMVFKESLQHMGEMAQHVEPSESAMQHGEVYAFQSLWEDEEKNVSNLFVACGDMIDDDAVIVFWGINCDLDKMILAEVNASLIDEIVQTFEFPSAGQ